ncbi:UDP-N-acetylglucosamine--N-acetylmuramyl-(pentapeptide) pyrophosphoryl-undecaprenol N-acetylglucosamine transferase [Sulfurovum sp. enrichment culture clone C5]|uniref:UDP-N-acetylglucosamine--N-acetylmuramyl-(pentapeptide) pyrophosphoryl-undecaprenol N-acetylglucosamine transferase n=1 Tax=Sulfurovum sp. enrichment culture clone C5 TaxID=497650 RepID=A0A0S4XLE2_9BACT|nr:UDP-N-acetylglucosamine--N-acetylmuramyl-(pentapeptide) pyrophosphoryl-undecaprenol N-acetylglucosamine transferase [Sulfurovum sp. enrichment culture clone C5]
MAIVMTGGGTGGHLAIIRAVKEELKNEKIIYIGSTSGQDKGWFGQDSDFEKKYFLQTRGVVNQGILGKIKSLWMLSRAVVISYKIIKQENIKVVFCVGGFSAAPASIASIFARVPLVIHEQNAIIGSLNRRLMKYAKVFISSYVENSPIKSYPIKKEFFEMARTRKNVKTILFLGGSQGSLSINNIALSLASWLKEEDIKIIHQAGEKNIENVKAKYKEIGIEADVFGFANNMPQIMAKADIAVARSGASTLWELSANNLPTIFVPYPYAAGDHQFYNAKFLVDQDLAFIFRENKVDLEEMKRIIKDNKNLEIKSKSLKKVIDKNGSKQIADLISQLSKQG